ncbi:SRPBCC family protein [Streptomyces sp. NPDC055709]
MRTIEETVEIAVPVRTAYNQWTQFKSFPRFMSIVRKVEQVRPTVTHWVVGIGPLGREFEAEIVEQYPDSRVAWRSLDRRPCHWGEVSFHPLASGRTAVAVRMWYKPRGVGELGELLGGTRRVVRSELEHFKEFIEGLGEESGAWRGTIHHGRVQPVEPEPRRSRVPRWPHG